MFCLNVERDKSLSMCKQFYENIFRNYILYILYFYILNAKVYNERTGV